MALKEKISITEFQKLQKENPEVDLSKIYIVISDEEWKKRQEIRIPDWIKTT